MKKNIINFVCFISVVMCMLFFVSGFLSGIKDYTDLRFSMFYEEEQDSLDLINIGASTTRCGYIPATSYLEEGVKSYNYCLDSLPFELIPYMLEECSKTQKDALFTIDLNSINYLNQSNAKFYSQPFLNNLKDKKFKNKILKELFDENSDWVSNIPLYQTHSNWQKVGDGNLGNQSGFSKKSYLKGWSVALSHNAKLTPINTNVENKYSLTNKEKDAIDNLIGVINKLEVRVVFYIFPKVITDLNMLSEQHVAEKARDYLQANGQKYIDVSSLTTNGELSIDDYYDFCHLSIDGAMKYSQYFNKELINSGNLIIINTNNNQKNEWDKMSKQAKKYLEKTNEEFKNGKNLKGNEFIFRKNKKNIAEN